jgi:hypothetical protein
MAATRNVKKANIRMELILHLVNTRWMVNSVAIGDGRGPAQPSGSNFGKNGADEF